MIIEDFKITVEDDTYVTFIVSCLINDFKKPKKDLMEYDEIVLFTRFHEFLLHSIERIDIVNLHIIVQTVSMKFVLECEEIIGYEIA